MAVKAALVRGRGALADGENAPAPAVDPRLERYASLFNARDWAGLRALIGDDCRLDLVSKSQRRGKEVGMYFDRYARETVQLRLASLDGRAVLAAHVDGAISPSYFILLAWDEDRVVSIRDFRYVPYIAREAVLD